MKDHLKEKYENSCFVFLEKEQPNFMQQLWDCVKLTNFFWAAWNLYNAPTAPWRYDFVKFRLDMDAKMDEVRYAE